MISDAEDSQIEIDVPVENIDIAPTDIEVDKEAAEGINEEKEDFDTELVVVDAAQKINWDHHLINPLTRILFLLFL